MSDVELDLEGVQEAVERVESAVQHVGETVERAIRQNSSSSWGLVWLWIAIVVYFLMALPEKAWHSKWRYSVQYDVPTSKVEVETKPHDCEFLTAPLGEKHCHYDLVVSTVRWATSTIGLPISSVDNGKTWSAFTPGSGVTVPKYSTVEEVYLSWEKKED